MISIKDTDVLAEVMYRFDPILWDIIAFINEIEHNTVITSGHRSGDKGVHGTDPCRAVDIRSWCLLFPEKIVEAVNTHWEYDYKRPYMNCALLHDAGSGEHIHLQVHPNTKRRT